MMLVAALTTGCRHKTQASSYPPPPPATRSRLPAVVPLPNVDDNLIASGRMASSEVGVASWYGPPYANHTGANGQIYDVNAMTAAHRTLPMGTLVEVTNLTTGQIAVVRITDRGPFVHGRTIDLSIAAAKTAGVYLPGLAQVKIKVVGEKPGADFVGGRWCVQVGAFLNKHHAEHLTDELQHRYDTAKVIEFQGPTGHWVRINPVGAGRTQAVQIARTIRTDEPDALPYLVRLD
jgi:rare lipoprotein A